MVVLIVKSYLFKFRTKRASQVLGMKKANIIMPFASNNVVRKWLFITIVSITALGVFGSKGRRYSPDIHATAEDKDGAKKKTVDSFSDSQESEKNLEPRHTTSSKETKDSADEDDSSSENKQLSTRGLRVEDYEPEAHVRVRDKKQEDDSEEDSDKLRRRKRYAPAFWRKGKSHKRFLGM